MDRHKKQSTAYLRPLDITSPKRNPRTISGWEAFYPYYAGFPEKFVENILLSAELSKNSMVLDPWNGSGTTTYTASRLNFRSIGIDLNPSMVVVAKSRLLHFSEADSIKPISVQIIKGARELQPVTVNDPLLCWFSPSTATRIRSLERSIRERLVGDLTLTSTGVHLDNISCLAASFYVALFAVCRDLTVRFRTSNPTWLKKSKSNNDRIIASDKKIFFILNNYLEQLRANLHFILREEHIAYPRSKIILGDTTSLDLSESIADFVVTSPPYCTRIDYTSATSIQLAVMQPLLAITTGDLSRKMMGSVRVPSDDLTINSRWGNTCLEFLQKIREHKSKASSGYYFKTHLDYFTKFDKSMFKISKWMKKSARAALVVQDSFYKEIHNDLPRIVAEMGESHGLKVIQKEFFPLRRTLAGRNPYSKSYRKNLGAVEAVICFEKR